MFPSVDPKQSFPHLEEKISGFWKENRIFEKSIESRPEENPYRFFDGPPFITGLPHYGHLLASTIKDAIPRYWTMKGKRVERVWGWDCHGIPIEDKVQKLLGIESSADVEKIGLERFTQECYKYTNSVSSEWKWYVDRLGRWVDFDHSYKTMDRDYMESVMWVFKQLYDKDLVYKGKRISLYSTKLGTPISNFEVAMDDSYADVNDTAITVLFDMAGNGGKWENTFILAWTTTPWTIPVNIALAVNQNLEYAKVSHADMNFIVALSLVETTFKGREHEVVERIPGKDLVGLSYAPPFSFYRGIDRERNFKVYHADFITEESGTGIAHQSPEFGDADFQLAKTHGLHITEALDKEGRYTAEISDYAGMFYRDANPIVTDKLRELDRLFHKEGITHRVAMCPRTQLPLIYKAQDSWFVNIQDAKEKLLKNNEDIYWFPTHLKNGRFPKSIEAAPDWCVSRTRYWATPMPVWIGYDKDGQEKDMKVFGSIEEIERASGMKVKDLHRPYIDEIMWTQDGLTYRRVKEVLDVWLESGSMPYAQNHYPFENQEKFEKSFPADFIAEYIGQVRAWFYIMHVISVLLFDSPAFKNVITTGVIYGSDGRKMSKSFNNYPDPKGALEKYGADAMRFYFLNTPIIAGSDIDINEEGMNESLKRVILPLWNTYSFFTTYANIDSIDPKDIIFDISQIRNHLDIWIISRLQKLIRNVERGFELYDIQVVTREIIDFVENLTNWYVRRSRRRFWKSENDSDKLQGYSTLYKVLIDLSKVLAPIAPFVSEEIFKNLTGKESVHLELFPEANDEYIDESLDLQMDRVQKIIKLGLALRASRKIRVRQPLASVTIAERFDPYFIDIIQEELNVKEVIVLDDPSQIGKRIIKPNARLIGPKFGKKVQEIIQAGKAGDFTELEDGKVEILGCMLEAEEYEAVYEPVAGGGDIIGGSGTVMAMDLLVTEALEQEGYARDVIRCIQEMRKNAGYNVSDRILVSIPDERLAGMMTEYRNHIESEVLGAFVEDLADPEGVKDVMIIDAPAVATTISIRKIR